MINDTLSNFLQYVIRDESEEMLKIGERLTAFLYLVIRDELPAGKVIKIIQEIESIEGNIEFTNGFLEALAADCAKRIISD